MKKFKRYFYAIYAFYIAFALFVALKHEDLVLNWSWDPVDTWTSLIRFVLKLGGIGLVLVFLEIIVENIHLMSKNRKIKSLEKEILELKAKMYDQSGAGISEESIESDTDDIEDQREEELED